MWGNDQLGMVGLDEWEVTIAAANVMFSIDTIAKLETTEHRKYTIRIVYFIIRRS